MTKTRQTVRAAPAEVDEAGSRYPVAPGNDPNFKADIPAELDDEALYVVTLWRSVEFLGSTLRPDQKITLKGSVVDELRGSILAAAKAT